MQCCCLIQKQLLDFFFELSFFLLFQQQVLDFFFEFSFFFFLVVVVAAIVSVVITVFSTTVDGAVVAITCAGVSIVEAVGIVMQALCAGMLPAGLKALAESTMLYWYCEAEKGWNVSGAPRGKMLLSCSCEKFESCW